MTREEAIRVLETWIERDEKMKYADRLENIEIYKMAIKALKRESQNSCILDEEASNALMDIILKEDTKSEIVPDYRDGWRLKDTHAAYWNSLGIVKEGDEK